jgi:hypothetical protein
MIDPINVFWCFVGILICPGITFCVILWMLGHPILGIIALFTYSIGTVLKERSIRRQLGLHPNKFKHARRSACVQLVKVEA